jgi:hypothetical protein
VRQHFGWPLHLKRTNNITFCYLLETKSALSVLFVCCLFAVLLCATSDVALRWRICIGLDVGGGGQKFVSLVRRMV